MLSPLFEGFKLFWFYRPIYEKKCWGFPQKFGFLRSQQENFENSQILEAATIVLKVSAQIYSVIVAEEKGNLVLSPKTELLVQKDKLLFNYKKIYQL